MKFLILYGTTEGQTRKVCEFIAERMSDSGHEAALYDATTPGAAQVQPRGYDAAIVAASIHAGLYQTAVEDFVRTRRDALNSMRTMFLSVSMGAASKDDDDRRELDRTVARFLEMTGWKPGEVHHVMGAFRFTRYDFLKRWALKMIARQKGFSTEADHDLEMTNWADLARIADNFVASVEHRRARPQGEHPAQAQP